MHASPRDLEGEDPPGTGASAAAQGEHSPAGAAEGEDPGPGTVAGELHLPGHLGTCQRLRSLQSPHASPPEEGPKADTLRSGPGLPRSVAASPGEGQAGGGGRGLRLGCCRPGGAGYVGGPA